MSKILIFAGLTLMLVSGYAWAQTNTMTSGRPSAVLTPERCNELWKAAVPEGDTLAQGSAAPFVVNFSQVDRDGNGSLTITEFEAGCFKGMVKDTGQAAAGSSSSTGSSAGTEGSK
jgi:hypothetical protein